MDTPQLDAATKMLDEVLPPGSHKPVGREAWHPEHTIRGHAVERGISWRTVEAAKRRAGNIRAIKQRGQPGSGTSGWVWAREPAVCGLC